MREGKVGGGGVRQARRPNLTSLMVLFDRRVFSAGLKAWED